MVGTLIPVAALAGPIVGEIVAHQASGFPPIWSKLQIRIYNDGRTETLLLQHSLFPSLTWYSQKIDAMARPEETFVRVNHPSGETYYNTTKDVHLPKWKNWGWGNLQAKSTPGPTRGNPWGITKGVF